MTQEEKAKAYDMAMEQAKKELNTCGSMDCDAARQIFRFFPQLRESEDEKMMRVIGLALTDVPEERFTSLGTTLKDCLTWIEQQNHDGKKWITPAELNRLEALRYEAGFNAGIRSEKEKQKEQKPWKVGANAYFTPEQKSEEESDVVPIRFEEGDGEKYPIVDYKLMEQKPAEWSEEDDYNIAWLIETLLGLDGDKEFTSKCKEKARWLKSLRPSKK